MNAVQPPNMLTKPGTSPSSIRKKKAISPQIYNITEKHRETCNLSYYLWDAIGLCILNDTGQQSEPSPLGDPLQNVLHCFQLFSWADLVKEKQKKIERKKTWVHFVSFWHLSAATVILYLGLGNPRRMPESYGLRFYNQEWRRALEWFHVNLEMKRVIVKTSKLN